ncbi:hypothetical protein CANFE04_11150 [Ligilactobacillus animalis]
MDRYTGISKDIALNRMQRDALAQMLVHPFLDIILNAKIKRYSYILQRLIVSECSYTSNNQKRLDVIIQPYTI